MIEFRKISDEYDPLFEPLYGLYSNAFPKEERRSWADLENVLKSKKEFELQALMSDGHFAGLFAFWNFSRFTYIEHFAVVPAARNHHLGSDALKLFMKIHPGTIILEVEPPKSIDASRRIHFYERLNFFVLPNFYMQPPYDKKSFLLPMLIMSNDYHFAHKHFEAIKGKLYEEVYQYEKPEAENKIKNTV